jgi:hypothetical protein
MMDSMKPHTETPEYDAFKALLNRLVAVPHSEILKREAAYKEKAALNPRKRGPKPKPSASPSPDASPQA